MGIEDKNLYSILGVKSSATQAEIQSAYKKKARELHPDVNNASNAEERFKELVAAYEVLSDEQKRSRYDAFGLGGSSHNKQRRRNTGRSSPFGSDFGFDNIRYEDIRVDLDDLKNPFDAFLRREQRRRAPPEREIKLSIPIEKAYTGTTLNVTLEDPMLKGLSDRQRFRIRIPPGAKEGDRLQIKESNITAVLSIEPHPRFELDGRDVTTTASVTPWDAALGGKISVATPAGTVRLTVPEGTSTGQKLRLRGQGLPQKPGRSGDSGDLFVRIKIVVPKTLSSKERKLFEELRQASSFEAKD